ncbi:hypothetical protein [Cobetia amphilecti]|uniref:hypothetical protein n=1 Tax=Cobetia amphilecti TaxID=1055104 RepID=UPI0026E45512|nr:hypothetical protein [Cobetia amphilecti]MDO6817145.1 hypothetical protein [Cobetia amphilecti]
MAGFNDDDKPIANLVGYIEEYLYVILSAIGPIVFAIAINPAIEWWGNEDNFIYDDVVDYILKFGSSPVFVAVISVLLLLVGAIGQSRDSKLLKEDNQKHLNAIAKLEGEKISSANTSRELEEKIRAEVEDNFTLKAELIEAYSKMAHIWICQIFNELDLNVKHRISIYYLDSERDKLVLLNRYAKNHDFNQQGRLFFSTTQGVLARVWREGAFFEKKIPAFDKANTKYYRYLDSNYGIKRDISSRLRMKSLTIGGYAIEDSHGHHIGAIIFESQDQDDFDEDYICKIVRRDNTRLVELIFDVLKREEMRAPISDAQKGGHNE